MNIAFRRERFFLQIQTAWNYDGWLLLIHLSGTDAMLWNIFLFVIPYFIVYYITVMWYMLCMIQCHRTPFCYWANTNLKYICLCVPDQNALNVKPVRTIFNSAINIVSAKNRHVGYTYLRLPRKFLYTHYIIHQSSPSELLTSQR